jgi:hypothetical protein
MSAPARVNVQGEHRSPTGEVLQPSLPAGTITWAEHLEAWYAYDRKWRCGQTAERLAERGGFSFNELCELLGHAPTTWQPYPPRK